MTSRQEARIRELMLLNLFGVFSEADTERRMRVIVDNYAEDVLWLDPVETVCGHAQFGKKAKRLLDTTPDFVFSAAGPIHVVGDLGYLPFNYGVPRQPPASSGFDIAQVRDGQIAVLYTFVSGLSDQEDRT